MLFSTTRETEQIQLENELEFQKKRFFEAAEKSASQIQANLQVENWIRDYPVYAAGICLLGGFLAAQLFYAPEHLQLKSEE